MKNVILIVNPVSGKLKGKAALFGVIEALSANDIAAMATYYAKNPQ
jgi:diacylglycerol kinase family enzyme